MTPSVQATYRNLLSYGLIQLRDAAHEKRIEVCQIQAEHLHNIPSLLEEKNIERHLYYFEKERTFFLEKFRPLKTEVDTFCLARFEEAWEILEQWLTNYKK